MGLYIRGGDKSHDMEGFRNEDPSCLLKLCAVLDLVTSREHDVEKAPYNPLP